MPPQTMRTAYSPYTDSSVVPERREIAVVPELNLLFRLGKMLVDLADELFAVNAVNGARLLEALASRSGAAETMHAHSDKEGRCGAVGVKDIAYYGIFCNCHDIAPPVQLYYTLKRMYMQ